MDDDMINETPNTVSDENEIELDELLEGEEIEDIEPDHIRPNSNTALIDAATSRFSGAEWFNKVQEQSIILAGLGGIGSYVAFLLSRMRPAMLYLYDGDRVERANMSGQLYSVNDIGQIKSSAIGRKMYDYSGYSNFNSMGMYQTSCPECKIMICGFDSMAAREMYFHKWLSYVSTLPNDEKGECLFIDGRLAAEEFQVLAIKGNDRYHIAEYINNWLFSDEEADPTQCSYKQTSHCANMIASVMVNIFTNFIANQCEPLVERDVPFLTTYDASTMYFKTVS